MRQKRGFGRKWAVGAWCSPRRAVGLGGHRPPKRGVKGANHEWGEFGGARSGGGSKKSRCPALKFRPRTFIAYFHAYFRAADQKRPQLGEYCHTAGKQGTDRIFRSHALQLAHYHGRFRRFWSKICTYCTRVAEKSGGALYRARNTQKRPKTVNARMSVLDW